MGMGHRLVFVGMSVWLRPIPFEIMLVLMMRIVPVPVIVRHRLVVVLMGMALADMQPNTDGHQGAGDPKDQRR